MSVMREVGQTPVVLLRRAGNRFEDKRETRPAGTSNFSRIEIRLKLSDTHRHLPVAPNWGYRVLNARAEAMRPWLLRPLRRESGGRRFLDRQTGRLVLAKANFHFHRLDNGARSRCRWKLGPVPVQSPIFQLATN